MNVPSSVSPLSVSPHLSHERLAAFDHDDFSVSETEHLISCAECRLVLEDLRLLVEQAARERDLDLVSRYDASQISNSEYDHERNVVRKTAATTDRLASWESIVNAMDPASMSNPTPVRAEGAFAVSANSAARQRSGLQIFRQWKQAAAAILLVLSGAALTRLSDISSQYGGDSANTTFPFISLFTSGSVEKDNSGGRNSVSNHGTDFSTIAEATTALAQAQSDYERAVMWLASNDSTTRSVEVYRARLAALDQMMAASRAALQDAPKDPVLSHYFITAWAAREATLQALGKSLPVDKTIERY